MDCGLIPGNPNGSLTKFPSEGVSCALDHSITDQQTRSDPRASVRARVQASTDRWARAVSGLGWGWADRSGPTLGRTRWQGSRCENVTGGEWMAEGCSTRVGATSASNPGRREGNRVRRGQCKLRWETPRAKTRAWGVAELAGCWAGAANQRDRAPVSANSPQRKGIGVGRARGWFLTSGQCSGRLGTTPEACKAQNLYQNLY
jgi:hypothetical protein